MNTTRRRKGRISRITRKNYVSKLKQLYPSCKHDTDYNGSSYDGHNITYGEMNYEGMKKLHMYVQKINPDLNTFIDIGSGRGKLCLYLASLRKIKKCIGIELVKSRYEDAIELKTRLSPAFADKVEYICANIFEVNIKEFLPMDANVFVWFSNLCFEQSSIDEIFEKIVNELPSGSIICCSKKTNSENNRILFIESVQIEMSWNKDSIVHIYELN
jgi:tRNA G46 methylase TrmB